MVEETPGWHPDPSGRHEHRFWDGSGWTNSVADGGRVAADPLGAGGPTSADPAGGPARRADRGRGRWLVGAIAAVVVIVVIVALVADDGSGGGTGPSLNDLKAGAPVARTLDLRAGEAVGFEVRAEQRDVKFRVAIAVDASAGKDIAQVFGTDTGDPYDTGDYSDFFGPGRNGRRLLYAGRARGSFAESFVAPASGTYTLAVRSESAVRLRLDIETQTKHGLTGRYSPVQLYRLRRDPDYRGFFERWDRRSQGNVGAFTDFSDPYSDANSDGSDRTLSDYMSEYSDYVSDSGGS